MKKLLMAASFAALMISPALAGEEMEAKAKGKTYGHMLENADSDGDGKISRDEFMTRHMEVFDKIDADKDGFLTEEEREASRGEIMKRVREHKHKYKHDHGKDDGAAETPSDEPVGEAKE